MTYTVSEEKNPKYFISWGMGIQSTAMGVMSCLGDIRRVEGIITADVGWEKSLTYKMMDYYSKFFAEFNMPLHVINNGNIRYDDRHLMPFYYSKTKSPIKRQCTGEYKIEPIRRKMRELCGLRMDNKGRTKKATAIVYLGISLDEAERMSDSNRNWVKNEYPLVDLRITREDCVTYLQNKNLPVPPKSACIGCPYTQARNWLWLKEKYRNEFDDAVEYDKSIRQPPKRMLERGFDGELYLWRGCIPLDEVNFEDYMKETKEDICDSGYCFI